jgi:hypothetical protein
VPRSGRSAGITATARFPMTGHGPQGQCHGIGFARQRPAGENGAGREAGPICHPPPATGQPVAPRSPYFASWPRTAPPGNSAVWTLT